MATEVVMPQMGESITEGTITKWLKKPGDTVARDEPLFEISTDKVDAEIPSPAAGTLKEIKFPKAPPYRSTQWSAPSRRAPQSPQVPQRQRQPLIRQPIPLLPPPSMNPAATQGNDVNAPAPRS